MEEIVILDFGGQYTHLIARRIRELGVYSEILPYNASVEEVLGEGVKGVILSGGPRSVMDPDSPRCSTEILRAGIPILGICYGHQLIAREFGGEIRKGGEGEFGRTVLKVIREDEILKGLSSEEEVWMSHKDRVEVVPRDFEVLALTEKTPVAAFRHKSAEIYGVQFHPEVKHTPKGKQILKNFLYGVCGCSGKWRPEDIVEKTIAEIKSRVGREERAVCAVSGGVDSTTAALIVHRAIGDRLLCIFVNHGLLRKGEAEGVIRVLRGLGLNLRVVNAKERFLRKLKGVRDPELKRRVIGEEFVRVFEEEARKVSNVRWLVQGTIYPDRIESGRAGTGASTIKTHHNVGGLPERMMLRLIEPLRDLYKDEVRAVARNMGIPEEIVKRHPFPGPGLAVRIVGEVTEEKLRVCREASAIIEEELKRAGWYDKVWQAFAVVGDDKWTGVVGDERREGYIVTVRIVESEDGMTADWVKIPHDVLERISNRITNELPEVSMVTYAISSKPPSTIEPQ